VISDFATAVFFANPQPKPATVDERKAARHQRLEIYFHVAEYRHIKMTFTQVCKLAGVPWMARGPPRLAQREAAGPVSGLAQDRGRDRLRTIK